ncbi:reverse transcriptase domain-containing protein [Tanacetum coccineum]
MCLEVEEVARCGGQWHKRSTLLEGGAGGAVNNVGGAVTDAGVNCGIGGVADALAERDADRSMNGDDSHDTVNGVRRQAHVPGECTYPYFMKCQPVNFKGTEGVVELTQWTVGHDVAYAMTWTNLKKIMTDKYCPTGEIKKLEIEMWNLKVKGTDVIEKYVGGLPDMIYGSVMTSKPKAMQDAIEFATELMDKKISTLAERQAENKRKLDNNNQAQQQPPKKSPAATNNQRNLTCYECGNQGHYRSDCPELKNQNHGNQAGGTGAQGMVHALGGGEINQDLNNMEDDINA